MHDELPSWVLAQRRVKPAALRDVLIHELLFHINTQEKIENITPNLLLLYQRYLNQLDVDFSYCWLNLVEAWYSLEQYIGLKEDKLSSTTVDFIRSEGNLETKGLYCFRKPKMC